MTWDQFRSFKKTWLFRIVVLLLVLVEVTSVAAMGDTLASYSAQQAIHYRNHNLVWDANTPVNASGVAELKIFSNKYHNVESKRETVFAPGTKGNDVITLVNESNKPITYIALSYNKNPKTIPYEAGMDAIQSADTTNYQLPEGVLASQVIRAVTGQVNGGEKREFNIHWEWPFYQGDREDLVDTSFGIRGIDEAVIGFWIYVEEEEDPTPPEPTEPDPVEPHHPHRPPHPYHPQPDPVKPVTPVKPCPCTPTPGCNCGGSDCTCNPGGGCTCGKNNCGGNSTCGSCKPTGCDCGCTPNADGLCECKAKADGTCGCKNKKIILPKTGDNGELMLYGGMTVLCGAVLAFLLIDPKKKEESV